MRPLYAERRDALVTALDGIGTVTGANAGIDLSIRLPDTDDVALCRHLAKANIEAMPLSRSAIATPISGLTLGFASFSRARIARAATTLRRVLARES